MSPSKVKYSESDAASVEQKIRQELDLSAGVTTIRRNAPPAVLYEDALNENKTAISSTGALIAYSGEKTGRSPRDKRIVEESTSKDEIWWGPVNKPCSERTWNINRERAADYLRTRDHLYIVDAFAGWDPKIGRASCRERV